jgi:hypothetical protein
VGLCHPQGLYFQPVPAGLPQQPSDQPTGIIERDRIQRLPSEVGDGKAREGRRPDLIKSEQTCPDLVTQR